MEFRHVLEVHAVDGADEGGGEQDRGPGRDLLDLLILSDARLAETFDFFVLRLRYERGVEGEDVGQGHPESADPFGRGGGVVGDIAEVAPKFVVGAVLVEAGGQAVEDFQQWPYGPL